VAVESFAASSWRLQAKKYEDVRVQFPDWPALKPKTPYGSLPVLEYKGQTYGQSQAIAFFLAREFGLAGKTNADGLRIQEVCALVEDLIVLLAKARFEKDEAKKAELQKENKEKVPTMLGYFEKHLTTNGKKGFFVGAAVTLADLAVFDITETVINEIGADSLAKFPLVTLMRKNVAAQSNVKAYLAKRKSMPF